MSRRISSLIILTLLILVVSSIPVFAEEVSCEAPALITSAGQSMEVKMVQMLCNKIGLENSCDNLATADMLNGMQTLMIVPGVSLKGMGTAGVDIGSENFRIKELGDRAKKDGIKTLVVHTGGHIRRDPVNDPVIEKALSVADYAIVCGDGNEDHFFNTQCEELGIPLIELENVSKLPETLKKIFSIQ